MVPRRDILDLAANEYDRILDTNLKGTFFLTQKFAKYIRNSSSPYRSIINVTSVNASMVSIEKSPYCISKAGLSMMSQLFAMKLAEYGVNVYEVRPGYTKTAMTAPVHDYVTKLIEDGLVPSKRWGEAEDVGKSITSLACGCLCYTTGDIIHVSGGMQVPRIK
jgi:NAD(P)-dependent dehydrogenase (short-subunit alcohol dehydrogenase family)